MKTHRHRQSVLSKACRKKYLFHHSIQNITTSHVFKNLLVDDEKQVIVCAIPKVGSAYWRKFFNPDNPRQLKGKTLADYTPEERRYRLRHYLKAMFVRHPLERLWSAYNDKIVSMVPYFLEKYGKAMIEVYRTNPQNVSSLCAHDVSFEEFVKYVTRIDQKQMKHNYHWAPFYEICFPCKIHYDIIGKLETFSSDIQIFFSKLGKMGQFQGNTEQASSSFVNMQQAACRIPFIHYKPLHDSCLSPNIMLSSKWKAWRNIGVISLNKSFPSTLPRFLIHDKMNVTKWFEYCISVLRLDTLTDKKQAVKMIGRRKTSMYERTFRKLPDQVLKAVKRVYEFDMALFGYKYLF